MNTASETHRPPEITTAITTDRVFELDVRPILKSGGEPFQEIMQGIAKTPANGAFRLLATFKPSPLFHVLGAQGWSHWIESGEDDRWAIWFYRSKDGGPKDGSKVKSLRNPAEDSLAFLKRDEPELQKRLKVLETDDKTWTLDVRLLPPPEPMRMTLSVLEKLPTGFTLIQLNERVPQFLLPILEERGFRFEVNQKDQGAVRVRIWRP